MVTNLRERAITDLARVRKDWALLVKFTAPDGTSFSALALRPVYKSVREDPQSGPTVVPGERIVTIEKAVLPRMPKANENWLVEIPETPSTTAALEPHTIVHVEDGTSLGYIRLYLRQVKQS